MSSSFLGDFNTNVTHRLARNLAIGNKETPRTAQPKFFNKSFIIVLFVRINDLDRT